MKKKWSVSKDPVIVVWGLAFLMFFLWIITLGAFPIDIEFTDGTEGTYGGWGRKLINYIKGLL